MFQGWLALGAVQVLFGLFPMFAKFAYQGFSPWALGAWRMVAGGGLLALVSFARHRRAAWPARADLPRLLVCSLLGVVINILLFLKGLELASSIYAGLTLPLIPVYTFALAVLLRQERFDKVRALGLALALLGALLLVVEARPGVLSGGGLSPSVRRGILLFFLNTFSYSCYLVWVRPLFARYPPLVVTTWVFLLAIPWVPIFARGEGLFPAQAPARAWIGLAYSVVGATVLSYLLNGVALARVSASTTASFIFLQPAIVLLAGVWVLREPLHGRTLLAAALTFAGVWLVARRR